MGYYDRGFRPRGGYSGGDWASPSGGYGGGGRERPGSRPWVGGYREGYQGGSGGYSTGGPSPDRYDRGMRYDREMQRGARDEWWLGGHRAGRYDQEYDRAYREFDRANRPHFSPVGGNYHAMGGTYMYGRPPRPLREDMWFSDWTRWF